MVDNEGMCLLMGGMCWNFSMTYWISSLNSGRKMERYAALGIDRPGNAASLTGLNRFLSFADIPSSIPDDILAGKLSSAEVSKWQDKAKKAYAKFAEEVNARERVRVQKNKRKRLGLSEA